MAPGSRCNTSPLMTSQCKAYLKRQGQRVRGGEEPSTDSRLWTLFLAVGMLVRDMLVRDMLVEDVAVPLVEMLLDTQGLVDTSLQLTGVHGNKTYQVCCWNNK